VARRERLAPTADQDAYNPLWFAPSAWVPAFVLLLLMALLVRMCGVNIPFNDDFVSPGRMFFDWVHGNLSWYSFWQQHNDSRLVIPRLIWLVEAFTVGWSTKHWMYASVVMCALEAYLLALQFQKVISNTFLRWTFAGCTALLLLHPRFGPEMFLRGSQGIALVPSLFIILGLFLYSLQISFRMKLVVYVVLSQISTLTFASGMIVWVLLFPVFPLRQELRDVSKDRRSILVPTTLAILCAVMGIGSYFVDYHGTPLTLPAGGLIGFSKYFFSWTGASLASVGDFPDAYLFGICLAAAGAACLAFATLEAAKERTLIRLEWAWPWIALVVYVFASGTVNTFTRSPFGLTNAITRRYFLITMQMTIGLAGLVPILICYRADGSPRRYQKALVAVAISVLLAGSFYAVRGWQSGFQVSHRHYRALLRRKIALSLWREAPFISPLPIAQVVPPPDRRVHYLTMVQAGLLPDYGGDWRLIETLKNARSRTPVGQVQVRGAGEKLKAFGWAIHPRTKTPFPAVLTVVEERDSELTPISVDLMNQKGPPLPGRLDTGESQFWVGFSTYPLNSAHAFAPAERLLFFAIDPEKHEAYPLRRVP
jgi:hypothetical protein